MASPDDFFNGALDLFLVGKLPTYVVFDLGLSPDLAVKRLPRAITFMPQSVLRKAVSKHRLDLGVLRNLPSLLSKPEAVFCSKTVAHSFVFLLSAKSEGEHLVLAAEYVHHADFGTSYMVKSVHRRPDQQIANWYADGLALYKK